MPTGVYKRTKKHREQIQKFIKAGHTEKSRKKAATTLKKIAQDPKWRRKVSEATRQALNKPKVRQRHLQALQKNLIKYGVGFKGGNGQALTEVVSVFASILEPEGFLREHPIKTKGHGTGLRAATAYKVDFGHPERKVAIELDGPSHKNLDAKRMDEKKDAVLKALGWEVIRIKHK